jgi:hypothetical protein
VGLQLPSFLLGFAYRLGVLSVSGRLRPTSVSGFPLAWLKLRMPCDTAFPRSEPHGSPKFLTLLSTPPTLFVDPGRPSGSSPNRCLCVGFWRVNTIARCLLLVTRLSHALGSANSPTGYVVPGVRFNCIVRLYIGASSTVATLGMSGWLDLAQQGLAPCKKRQASLGALTQSLTASRPTMYFRVHPEPQAGGDAVQRLDTHPGLLRSV